MSRDAQIVVAGQSGVPLSYTVSNAVELILRAVNATFDGSGAAGDFKPTIEVVSDGGVVVARVPTDATVTAGDSAEVTFAPFLRSAAAESTLLSSATLRIVDWTVGGAAIPDSTETQILVGNSPTIGPTNQPMTAITQPFGFGQLLIIPELTDTSTASGIWVSLDFHWPAFNGPRYIACECSFDSGATWFRFMQDAGGTTTPSADTQTAVGGVYVEVTTPTPVQFRAFCWQNSGGVIAAPAPDSYAAFTWVRRF